MEIQKHKNLVIIMLLLMYRLTKLVGFLIVSATFLEGTMVIFVF